MSTVLELERKDAIKKIAGFHENLSKQILHRPDLLKGTKEECKEICMNLVSIKDLLKDSKSQKVIFFAHEWDMCTLPKKRLKVYFPGGKKYWEEFMYLKC